MLEQLRSAGEKLRASIDDYLGVCSTLLDCPGEGNIFSDISQELSSHLEEELALISLYEQRIRQARVAIGRAHNSCSNITPISKLPPEILSHIFHLVPENPCCLSSPDNFDRYPSHSYYPDQLIQVCSRWREIGLSSPTLWTHLDLTPEPHLGGGIWDRAYAYSERAGRMLCDIHIDDDGCSGNYYNVDRMIPLLASRSKALDFTITSPELSSFHSDVLQGLITECNSKLFKTLRICAANSLPVIYIRGCNDASQEEDIDIHDTSLARQVLRLSDSQIDDSLSGLTTLHLQGVLFEWSRRLYYDLVDLRITSPPNGHAPVILESDFVSILSRSPQLKVLHFSLDLLAFEDLGDDPMGDNSPNSVPLQDLEEVYVSTACARVNNLPNFHVGLLLRLLAPGPKPLRLTLETTRDQNEHLFCSNGTRQFFARSKVEKLWVRKGTLTMADLSLCRLLDLKVLVLDSCEIRDHSFFLFQVAPDSCTCIVYDATLYWSVLNWIIISCHSRLVASKVRVLVHGITINVVPEEELRMAFPNVRFLGTDSQLGTTVEWDILNRYVFPSN